MVATLALALSASVLDAPVATALLILLERSAQPAAKTMPLLEQQERKRFAILQLGSVEETRCATINACLGKE